MALTKNHITPQEFEVPESYIKLMEHNYSIAQGVVHCMFNVYKDSSKEILIDRVAIEYAPDFSENAVGFAKEAYRQILKAKKRDSKTNDFIIDQQTGLPELLMEGAQNVLEEGQEL